MAHVNTTAALLALAAAALVARPAAAQSASGRPPLARDAAACSAIATAIDSLVLRHDARPAIVLWHETAPVREHTVPADMWKRIRAMPGLDRSTWSSFVAHNARAEPTCLTMAPLPNRFTRRSPATDGTPIEEADAERWWRRFRARYPGAAGRTSTSGVGIGRDGRQALLMLDHGCGGECGSGHVVLLERDARTGRWRIRSALVTWVS